MPWCYGNSGGYGRFLERRSQPLDVPAPKPKPAPPKKGGRRSRPVECVEIGEIYASPHAAASAQPKYADGRKIRAACQVPGKTAYGYHWRWADEKEGGKSDG